MPGSKGKGKSKAGVVAVYNDGASMEDHEHGEDSEGQEEEDEDSVVCDVCKDGGVYENNDIVYCDICGVTVHQYCYGLEEVPPGDLAYKCRPCEKGLNPKVLSCALCAKTGGALKPTADGRWAHVACAMWIPEVYFGNLDEVEPVCLERIDPARNKLRCVLCREKGTCLQCSGGRCLVAYHPYCMFQHSKRIIRRIVQYDPLDASKGLHFQTFCEKHHNLAGKPTKKGPSDRSQARAQFKTSCKRTGATKESGDGEGGNGASKSKGTTAADERKKDLYEQLAQHMPELLNNAGLRNKGSEGTKGNDAGMTNGGAEGHDSDSDSAGAPPSLPSFMEWPGQQIGEEMDLDHFWSVIGSYFPEEHDKKWLQKMVTCPELPAAVDSIFTVPKIGDTTGSEDGVENDDERDEQVNGEDAEEKQASGDGVDGGGGGGGARGGLSDPISSNHMNTTESGEGDRALVEEERSLQQKAQPNGQQMVGPAELSVVIESEGRKVGVHYYICSMESFKENPQDSEWHVWTPQRVSTSEESGNGSCSDECRCVGEDNLAAGGGEGEEERVKNHAKEGEKGAPEPVYVALQGWEDVAGRGDADIEFSGEGDDTELCMELRQLQGRLRQWTQEKQHYLAPFLVGAEQQIEEANKARARNDKLVCKYQRMQAWKHVAQVLEKGVGDQVMNTNKMVEEVIPASWQIPVAGRPTKDDISASGLSRKKPPLVALTESGGGLVKAEEGKGSAASEDGAVDDIEDAVCMVCFDGATYDDNEIVYCDGCNMCVHQLCYGMQEIPEGDFYCARCSFLQLLSLRKLPFTSDTVSCCLCKSIHGGFKHTTDNHWCHLACAIFAPGARIKSVEGMGPVDVSGVDMVDARVPGAPACTFCGKAQGCLLQCMHMERGRPCTKRFHFLCAWFSGAYLNCSITDTTFLGGEETVDDEGNTRGYPTGIDLHCLCLEHGDGFICHNKATKVVGKRNQELQRQVRLKYKVKEETDMKLKSVRKGGRARSRKIETGQGGDGVDGVGEGATTSTMRISRPHHRQMKEDKYEGDMCAVCITPAGTARDPSSLKRDGLIQCSSCAVRVHRACYLAAEAANTDQGKDKGEDDAKVRVAEEGVFDADAAGGESDDDHWKCDLCMVEESRPVCVLCPRIGGAYHSTDDQTPRWVHAFCANHTPGVMSVQDQETDRTRLLVDAKNIPKDLRKRKCSLCGRKDGACVRCAHHGCSCFFHPLCARLHRLYFKPKIPAEGTPANGGAASAGAGSDGQADEVLATKATSRSRDTIYCQTHTPHGLYRLSNGHWIDMHALYRLRADLDRSRLIVDMTRRREKVKRTLWRTLCDHFDMCVKHLEAVVPQRKKVLQARLDAIMQLPLDASSMSSSGGGPLAGTMAAASAVRASAGVEVASADQAALEMMPYGKRPRHQSLELADSKTGPLLPGSPIVSQHPVPAAEDALAPRTPGKVGGRGIDLSASSNGFTLNSAAKGTRRSFRGAVIPTAGRTSIGVIDPALYEKMGGDMFAVYAPLREGEGLRYSSVAQVEEQLCGSAGPDSKGRASTGAATAASVKKRKRLGSTDGSEEVWIPLKMPTVGDRSISGPYADSCLSVLQGVGVWNGVCYRLEQPEGDFDQVLPPEKARGRGGRKGGRGSAKISEPPDRTLLYRQLLQLIGGIIAYEVARSDDLGPLDDGELEGRGRRARHTKGSESIRGPQIRQLCEPFLHLPTKADQPLFYRHAIDPIDLTTIRSRVIMCQYKDTSELMRDVEHCLNTWRTGVTDRQLIHDTHRLWQVTEALHGQIVNGDATQLEPVKRIRTPSAKIQAQVSSAKLPTKDEDGAVTVEPPPDVLCAKCSCARTDFPLTALELPKERIWYCANCIIGSPGAFCGCTVQVRVTTPRGFYWRAGVVQAFEPISGRHRMAYDNGDWDFVFLDQQRLAYASAVASLTAEQPHPEVVETQSEVSGVSDVKRSGGSSESGGGDVIGVGVSGPSKGSSVGKRSRSTNESGDNENDSLRRSPAKLARKGSEKDIKLARLGSEKVVTLVRARSEKDIKLAAKGIEKDTKPRSTGAIGDNGDTDEPIEVEEVALMVRKRGITGKKRRA